MYIISPKHVYPVSTGSSRIIVAAVVCLSAGTVSLIGCDESVAEAEIWDEQRKEEEEG